MSSLLLSQPFQITEMVFNTLLNSVNEYNNFRPYYVEYLLPELNTNYMEISYQNIINEADMTLNHISQVSRYHFFLFKLNGQVYKIITNENATDIYDISVI